MEQKFTTMAQEVIGDAIQSASAAGNAQVETLHVMDALLRQENGVIQGLIQAAGGNPQAIGAAVRNALVKMPAASGSTTSQPQASRQLTAALAQAEKEMQQMGDEYVSTEHLLIGIVEEGNGMAMDILMRLGVSSASIKKAIEKLTAKDQDKKRPLAGAGAGRPGAGLPFFSGSDASQQKGSGTDTLKQFATNLTQKARDGELDPVIGREDSLAPHQEQPAYPG